MEKGDLRSDLEIIPAIFNFGGMLSGIIQLAANKEEYIIKSMGLSKNSFWIMDFFLFIIRLRLRREHYEREMCLQA